MSQVLLVRHGQASWGSADYDVLSDLGERQSRMLGEALAARGVVPDLVVRGAMRRHRQTAEQAVAGAGWAARRRRRRLERVRPRADARDAPAGRTARAKADREQFQAWFEEATLRWTGGAYDEDYDESFTAFGARVDAALRRTVERLEPKQTAVVLTSGGPVSWVAASLLAGGADLWTQLNPVTVNSSVTKIVVGRRGATWSASTTTATSRPRVAATSPTGRSPWHAQDDPDHRRELRAGRGDGAPVRRARPRPRPVRASYRPPRRAAGRARRRGTRASGSRCARST